MAKQNSLFLTWKYRTQGTKFVTADGINSKTIAISGLDKDGLDNDSNLLSISLTSNDTVNNYFNLSLTNGSVLFPWLSVFIPLIAPALIFATTEIFIEQGKGLILDSNNNIYYKLASGWSVLGGLSAPVSSGKEVSVICVLEDF